MSEICHYNWGTPWVNPLPRYEFADGDHWGHQLFQDIAAGASAWTYWNMILDETGGSWLVSKVHGDPEIVEARPQHHDHLGIFGFQVVVLHHAGLHPALHEEPQDLQGGVRHDADVDVAVVVDEAAVHRVHVRAPPQLMELRVRGDASYEGLEPGVAFDGDPKIHKPPLSGNRAGVVDIF